MVNLEKITRGGRCFVLAYDQGFEHGPVDFDDKNVDPQYIFDIAESTGVFTGIAVQKGIAEKYYKKEYKTPLILKLNGKTAYRAGEELFSAQNCSVQEAFDLGASAVGYTIYIGSERETESFSEFGKIVKEAHEKSLPVILWAYPRGKKIGDKEKDPATLAYAARIALELGADMAKVAWAGSVEDMSWVVKSAGKTKILVVGGNKVEEEDALLKRTAEIVESGACGWAMGRNIWQSKDPLETARKIAKELYAL